MYKRAEKYFFPPFFIKLILRKKIIIFTQQKIKVKMEIIGKIIEILPAQTGTSAKGEWKKQEFILETQAQFPKKVIMANWNDKIDLKDDNKNKLVKVFFDLESREYNGRWYTDVKPWKLEATGPGTGQGVEEKNNAESADLPWDNDPGNDLPF